MIEFKALTKAVWMALSGTTPPPSQRAYIVDSVAVLLTGQQFTDLLWLLWLLFGGAMGVEKVGGATATAIANWRKPT